MKKMKLAALLALLFVLMAGFVNARTVYVTRSDDGTSENVNVSFRILYDAIGSSGILGTLNLTNGSSGSVTAPLGAPNLKYEFGINTTTPNTSVSFPLPSYNGNADVYTYAYPTYGLIFSVLCTSTDHYEISLTRTPPPL